MARETVIAGKGHQEADYLFRHLCRRLQELHGDVNLDVLRQSFELALAAHEGQLRKDGSPYIMHPLEVAEICINLNLDEESIIAAILHDTVEDTPVRLSQIKQQFGDGVARMVDNLTKIKKIDFFARFTGRNKASMQARNLQRLFVAMTSDMRVILIKLADRLHNMQTMGPMPEHKRQRICRETLEFYIPIARRLGLGQIVGQLEDLVFRYLDAERYRELDEKLQKYFQQHEQAAEKMVAGLTKTLEEAGLNVANIYGRRKHVYSVFKKMQRQGVAIDGIYDLLAIRIILDGTALDCYKAMGVIHGAYKPMFHRFRDFISSPKENGYQTLHTTVLSPDGSRVECQIRTIKMDLEAEKGVASHWRYKESTHEQKLLKDAAWMEFIRELTSEAVDTEDFVAKTRDALLGDQVLVLSPMGEVVNLPLGSTPVDFAYYIHTDLGHAMRMAKVNGVQMPLDYRLKNGDVVEIIKTSEFPPNPQPEWLVFAKSPKSLLKLRRYYRSRPKSERIEVGRSLLRQYIVKEGLYPLNLTANEKLMQLLKQLPVRSIDDIYEGVALATFRVDEIIQQLKAIHKTRVESQSQRQADSEDDAPPQSSAPIGLAGSLGVCLPGQRALRRRTELSSCCTPVPGDKIYGIWDRDTRRVKVHRTGCTRLKTPVPGATIMELAWQEDKPGLHYPARLSIISLNRVGLLFEVMKFLSASNINLGGAEFSVSPSVVSPDRMAQFDLIVDVEHLEELESCMAGIEQIGDVIEVRRSLQKPEKPPAEAD